MTTDFCAPNVFFATHSRGIPGIVFIGLGNPYNAEKDKYIVNIEA